MLTGRPASLGTVDDRFGAVGMVNLDYRNLYLHFECGAWLYDTLSIEEIRVDFMLTLGTCEAVGPKAGPVGIARVCPADVAAPIKS